MLVELGLVEQRYQAVMEVLAGASVVEVARRYGVVRQTVHGWLRRYAESGLAGLADRTSKPDTCPHQMAAVVEARIVEMRRAHPAWGPRTIRYWLEREGVVPVPSRSGVYRALLRHGLVDRQKRRRRRGEYRRWERGRAMELWQMDVMGGVFLADGTEVKVVTGIDDHARNAGNTWGQVNTFNGGFVTEGLALDPTNPQRVYAGTFSGGVFRSTDGGATWSPLNDGLATSGVAALFVDPTGRVYAGPYHEGIYRLVP